MNVKLRRNITYTKFLSHTFGSLYKTPQIEYDLNYMKNNLLNATFKHGIYKVPTEKIDGTPIVLRYKEPDFNKIFRKARYDWRYLWTKIHMYIAPIVNIINYL